MPGFTPGVADGAQENGREFSQFADRAVRKDFVRAKISVSTKVILGVVEFDAEFLGGGIEHFHGFPSDFHLRCRRRRSLQYCTGS